MADLTQDEWLAHRELDRMPDPHRNPCEAVEAENERLRSLLTEVLGHFTQPGHPGRACLRTHWIAVEKVEGWWASVRPDEHDGALAEGSGDAGAAE